MPVANIVGMTNRTGIFIQRRLSDISVMSDCGIVGFRGCVWDYGFSWFWSQVYFVRNKATKSNNYKINTMKWCMALH